jgi:heptosyltransferase-2
MSRGSLLIRLPNWVGDGALAAPAVRALQAARPDRRLILVGTARSAPLYGRWPADAVLTVDRKSSRDVWRLARTLREGSVEEALILAPSFRSALSPYLARVGRRIGFPSDGRAMLLSDPVPAEGRDRHLAGQYLKLAARLGARADAAIDPSLPVGVDERQAASNRVETAGLEPGRTIALCPGATFGDTKRWPASHWLELGRSLAGRGWSIAVLGGREEMAVGESLADGIGGVACSFAGRLDLRGSLAVLCVAAGAVSNDSGLLHLAVAAACPVVGVFGSTNPEWTGPLGEGSAVVRTGVPCSPCYAKSCPTEIECLRDLRPESVLESLERLLQAREVVEK